MDSGSVVIASDGRAAVRAAEALLRVLGGTRVSFRVMAATAGSGADLGLSCAAAQEVELAPVVVRCAGSESGRRRYELLVSAAAVAQACARCEMDDSLAFFAAVVSVEHRGVNLRVERHEGEEHGGTTYLHRVMVTE